MLYTLKQKRARIKARLLVIADFAFFIRNYLQSSIAETFLKSIGKGTDAVGGFPCPTGPEGPALLRARQDTDNHRGRTGEVMHDFVFAKQPTGIAVEQADEHVLDFAEILMTFLRLEDVDDDGKLGKPRWHLA